MSTILITGANGNVARGIIPRLLARGHRIVLSDVHPVPDREPFKGLPFVQCDAQAGFGLERAAAGCDLIIHLPAWHGIHEGERTEMDFWRLNVDGTFWMFQAARSAGIKRVVFASSIAWYGHYNKYGFTKRIGEELCEYHRRNHGVRSVVIRPGGFVPWGNYLHFGADLLYGCGVHRDDVLDCFVSAVDALERPQPAEPETLLVCAVRPNAFTAEDIADWERDPLAHCERIFPGSRRLVTEYGIDVRRRPELADWRDNAHAELVGYRPKWHFGTFIQELGALHERIGKAGVAAMRCPF